MHMPRCSYFVSIQGAFGNVFDSTFSNYRPICMHMYYVTFLQITSSFFVIPITYKMLPEYLPNILENMHWIKKMIYN